MGLISDNNLTWIPHLNKLKDKIDHLTYRIKHIGRATWGLKPIVIKKIYKLVIEKLTLYGAAIWFKPHAKILTKVPQLQRQAMLIITKCYNTVSYDALSILSGCLPIDLVLLKELEFQEDLKKMEISENKVNLNIRKNNYNIEYPIVDINCRTVKDQRLIDEIYTDGSKMNGQVGSAIIVYKNKQRIHQEYCRLNNEATVYMAELLAIKKAIDYVVMKRDYRNNAYVIISDSMSALQSISSLDETRKFIINLRNKI